MVRKWKWSLPAKTSEQPAVVGFGIQEGTGVRYGSFCPWTIVIKFYSIGHPTDVACNGDMLCTLP